jgi:hypothetical protein
VVVALGVSQQEDLDEAITAHGRILHDATVTSLNLNAESALGSINWNDPAASSLSELVTELAADLGLALLDEQIATALLTGIVSATERFSNDRTGPQAMSASAILMGAGANQQLVASKLEEPVVEVAPEVPAPVPEEPAEEVEAGNDGTIEIDHSEPSQEASPNIELPEPDETAADEDEPSPAERPVDEEPAPAGHKTIEPLKTSEAAAPEAPPEPLQTEALAAAEDSLVKLMPPAEQPAGSAPEAPASLPAIVPGATDVPTTPSQVAPVPAPAPPVTPPEPAAAPSTATPATAEPAPADANDPDGLKQVAIDPNDGTLTQLETAVSAAPDPAAATDDTASTDDRDADKARDEVNKALNAAGAPVPPPAPVAALNAQPLGESLHDVPPTAPEVDTPPADQEPQVPQGEPTFSPFTNAPDAQPSAGPGTQQPDASKEPPPVPPPLPTDVIQSGNSSQQQ